ncbi:MAG: response regulator [Candidatus Paceibacterota bacterium]|jgi:CheY-like chemotaxis protein
MAEQKKEKVLIVDDDKFLLSMYTVKFKNAGFEVDMANGGAEALSKLQDGNAPDILILDLIMPGMDGYEFLAKVREQKLVPKATVVVLTNQGQPEDIEKAKKYNVQGYIVKASTIPSEVLEEVMKIHKSKNN